MYFKKGLFSLFSSKKIRYLVAGGSIFLINIGLMWVFVDVLGFSETSLARNLSHLASTEIALLIGFVLHDSWTWKGEKRFSLWQRLLAYHLIALGGIGIRVLAFLLLDMAGMNWLVATVIPLVFVVVLNFLGFDKISFRKKTGNVP